MRARAALRRKRFALPPLFPPLPPLAHAPRPVAPPKNHSKFFETFSYLPPLTNDQIAKQVDYIVNNGWTPCLEFSNDGYVNNVRTWFA